MRMVHDRIEHMLRKYYIFYSCRAHEIYRISLYISHSLTLKLYVVQIKNKNDILCSAGPMK